MQIAARSALMPFSIGKALVLPRSLASKTKNGLMSTSGASLGLKAHPHRLEDHRLPATADAAGVGRAAGLSVSVR